MLKTETYYSSTILFIVLILIITGMMLILNPNWIKRKDNSKKVNYVKLLISSGLISLIVTLSVALFSEKIDDIAARKNSKV